MVSPTLMPEVGVEPTRPFGQGVLSLAGEMPPCVALCRDLSSQGGLRVFLGLSFVLSRTPRDALSGCTTGRSVFLACDALLASLYRCD